jgi:hypothetical protein
VPRTPLDAEAKADLIALFDAPGDPFAGKTRQEKLEILSMMTYVEFLSRVLGLHPQVAAFFQDTTKAYFGAGIVIGARRQPLEPRQPVVGLGAWRRIATRQREVSGLSRISASNLHGRRQVDFVDGFRQSRVKVRVAHRMPEIFEQGS